MATFEVLSDRAAIIEAIRRFQGNTTRRWCACVDSSLPAFSVGKVKEGYVAARRRGVKIMYITEVTKENAKHCREIMQFAELRHLPGVRGNFAVSDTEYVAGDRSGDALGSLVYCSAPEFVKQQLAVFETLWNLAAPAKI